MKNKRISNWTASIIAMFIAALALAACSNQSQPSAPTATPETINASLESLAKLFAKAATDPSVRQHIQQQVALRFDGDTEVLYKTLATPSAVQAQSSSVDIRQALANAYTGSGEISSQAGTGQALEAVDTLANSIPRFQVAVPEQFDTWDAQTYTPLVAYVPVGTDDVALKEIKAFDSEGNEYVLGARTPPTRPVIILSQNERTDEAGQLLTNFSEDTGTSEGALAAQASSYEVKMGTVELYDDHEPWIKGDPEIWLIAQSLVSRPELATRQSFDGANDEDYRYVYKRYLGKTRHDVVFYWYESDGSSYDVSISVKGVTLGFKINDSDDPYGYITVPHASLAGTSSAYYNLGGLEFSAY
jgi:Protein of unknown function (DUF3103)